MPGSVRELERAYEDAKSASDYSYFLRLRDYLRLIHTDPRLSGALLRLKGTVDAASESFAEEDEQLTRDLVICRDVLVKLAPQSDDSGEEMPKSYLVFVPRFKERIDRWPSTLANFDAIVANDEGKVVKPLGLDNSASRMLHEILRDKLFELRSPEGVYAHPDLDDLDEAVASIGKSQKDAHDDWVEVARDSGYLALLRLEAVISNAEPGEVWQLDVDSTRHREFIEELLTYKAGALIYLADALRPPESVGFREDKAQEVVGKHEAESRQDLENLHWVLRRQLTRRWNDLSGELQVGIIAVVVAALGSVAAVFFG